MPKGDRGPRISKVYFRIRYRPATRGQRKTHPFEFANVYGDYFWTNEEHVRKHLPADVVDELLANPGRMRWRVLDGATYHL